MTEQVAGEVVMDSTEQESALEVEVKNHAFALRGMAVHLMEIAGRLELVEGVLDEMLGVNEETPELSEAGYNDPIPAEESNDLS